MRRPPPFSDSFSTHEATLSVEVARPFGEEIAGAAAQFGASVVAR